MIDVLKHWVVSKLKPYPWNVTIELTTCCNSKCFYCGRTKNVLMGKDMDEDTLSTVFARIKVNGVPEKIVFGGNGEPLLFKFFDNLLSTSKAFFPRTHFELITNGIELHNHYKALLQLDSVVVSLNHSSRESYLENNGVDKHEQVTRNLLSFLEVKGSRKPDVTVQLLDLPNNQSAKSVWLHYWKGKLNCNDKIQINPLYNVGGLVLSTAFLTRDFVPCYMPTNHLFIDRNADAYGCCFMSHGPKSGLYLGNLKYRSIADLQRTKAYKRLVNSQVDGERSLLDPCMFCNLWADPQNRSHYTWLLWKYRKK